MSVRILLAALAATSLTTVVLLTACDDQGPEPVATVTVTPSTATIQVGETHSCTATLRDAGGNVLTGRQIAWSSSSTSVATVTSTGQVTGIAAGAATITATSEGKTGSMNLTVTPIPVATVDVTAASTELLEGESLQLTATTHDAQGNVLTGREVAWSSSDTDVAAVTAAGLVTGVAAGSVTITATSEGMSGSIALTVMTNILPGGWRAEATFGTGDFVINPSSTALTWVRFRSSGFLCGSVTVSGAVEFSGTWAIADRQFDVQVTDPITGDQYAFAGTIGASGNEASGSWSLTISGSSCSGTWQGTSMNLEPMAVISNPGKDTTVTPGDAVDFQGTATDPDGTIASHTWDFGDGNGSEAEDPGEYTFANTGTYTVTYQVTDDRGETSPVASVEVTVQSPTALYLRYDSPDKYLSNEAASSGYTKVTLYNYGSGQSIDFPAVLDGGMNGTNYGFTLWLGAGTSSGQTGTWLAEIIVDHDGVLSTLATHTFSVPFNTDYVEYTADVTGTPGGAAEDTIILRLTVTDVSRGGILFGAPPADSHILVPGTVTVSRVLSPVAASGAVEGVDVEVGTGRSLEYSGR